MQVIRRHRSTHDPHLPRLADFPEQVPAAQGHVTLEHREAVLRDPHEVVLEVVETVPGMVVLGHPRTITPTTTRSKRTV